DDERDLGIRLHVAVLAGGGEVPAANLDDVEVVVVGPADRHDAGLPGRIDGGQPPQGRATAQVRGFGRRERAHHASLFPAPGVALPAGAVGRNRSGRTRSEVTVMRSTP